MRKNVQKTSVIALLFRSVAQTFHSLFFTDDRDFQRLKNFIAS